ncbi:hypothetical protein F5Y06DRAFT_294656 [Hypoxylon sp. FL0890]|nr:hypothetical protein F5Y06DRAFT_294656 [Hypoxylon sp. FL0890]
MRLRKDSASIAMASSYKGAKPAGITQTQYHDLADEYLDVILAKFEEKQDDSIQVSITFRNLESSFRSSLPKWLRIVRVTKCHW